MTDTSVAPIRGRELERVARAGGASIVGAGVSAVAGVAVTVLITNGFDQSTAGTIFAATALFLVATAVVQLGAEVGMVKSLPTLVVTGRFSHVRTVLAIALLTVLLVSVAVGTAGFILSDEIAALIAPEANPVVLSQQVKVLAVFLPVAALYNVLVAASRGLRTMAPTVVVESLGRSVAQLVCVGTVVLLGVGAVATVLAWSFPFALALVAAAVWMGRLLRSRRLSTSVATAVATQAGGMHGQASLRGSVAEFWRFTGPRALATVSQMVLKRVDIVLVAALRTPAEAALYAAATRFVVLGQLGVQALQQALSPHLSAHFANDEHVAARETYRAATAWSMLLAWPIYLSCAVLAPELLAVFGDGYATVAPIVVMLCLAMLVATACGAVDTVLLMSGHTWLSLVNNVGALVLNLLLNLLLIPAYGAMGAGVAWATAIIVRNLLPLVQIARKYRISPLSRQTGYVAVFSVLFIGILPAAVRWASAPTGWLLVALVVGYVGFAVVVWRLRVELQLRAFRSMLRRRRRKVGTDARVRR